MCKLEINVAKHQGSLGLYHVSTLPLLFVVPDQYILSCNSDLYKASCGSVHTDSWHILEDEKPMIKYNHIAYLVSNRTCQVFCIGSLITFMQFLLIYANI